MKILWWLWQLPQHLLGYTMSRLWKRRLILLSNRELEYLYGLEALLREKTGWNDIKIFISGYYSQQGDKYLKHLSGFSIGRYICLNDAHGTQTVRHELGHCIQSQRLGWLYLPVVGIASAVFNNLWDRAFHKEWASEKRHKWYYSRFPEKQADRLGGVERKY